MNHLSRRIPRCLLVLRFSLLSTCLAVSLAFTATVVDAAPPGQLHDDLNYHFLPASVLGQGDTVALAPDTTSAFSVNPAALAIRRPVWAVHVLRSSRREVVFQHLDVEEQYTDYLRYRREAVGTENLLYARPLGRGSLAVNVALQHEGSFQRVDTEGKQINSFPESIWTWGLGYGVRLFHNLRIGADVRRLRVKPFDEDASIGWGYVYSLGLTESLGKHVALALAGRNLTPGVSLHLDDGPTQIEPQLHFGIGLNRLLSDRLHVRANWTFPAHEGMRVGVGAEVMPWPWLHLRAGYVRDVLRRALAAEDLEFLGEDDASPIVRLWKREGITLGTTLTISRWSLTLAWAPQLYPRAGEGEIIRVASGASQLAVSLTCQ